MPPRFPIIKLFDKSIISKQFRLLPKDKDTRSLVKRCPRSNQSEWVDYKV